LKQARRYGNIKGFTLLEALFAIVILMIGLMAVVAMIDVSYSASTLSKSTTKATHLAAWMMDRIKQDTSLATQIYTTNISSLRSFDNDATGAIVIDTDSAAVPALEPGRTACQQWRAMVQGQAVPSMLHYLDASGLPGDRLPMPRGVVTITPYDPLSAGNHTVVVQVTWQGILQRGVRLESVLASAE
jgi:type IV pilus modification protein PilV